MTKQNRLYQALLATWYSILHNLQNTISTWKKWSSGESGPGGRISGSVCGLDPK